MINLLPPIKKSITNGVNSTTSIHEVMWSVADSHPKHGKISHYIESEITQDDDLFYDDNIIYFPPITMPFQEPNLKHAIIYYDTNSTATGVVDNDNGGIFKSPLHPDVVGVADEPELYFQPPKLTHKTINYKDKVGESNNNRCFILKLINSLPISIELFVQKNLNMMNTTVQSNAEISRLVSGIPPENGAFETATTTGCWLTTMKRATVLSSSRQAIKEFVFDTRNRIGLEVEIVNDALTCVSVLGDSQASRYKTELDGAEMVAVNGVRVMTLDDFGEHVRLATTQGYRISLTVVAFVDSKAKNDVLQMRSMKRKLAVTSMFSNLMRIGLDKDYHGDIHEDADKDDDDKDDNNDQVQECSAEGQSVEKDESADKEYNSNINDDHDDIDDDDHDDQDDKDDDDKDDDDHDELSTLQTRSSTKSFRKDDSNSVDNDDEDHVDDDDDESGMKANRTKYLLRKEKPIIPLNLRASTSTDSDESSSLNLGLGGILNNNTWAITNKEEVYDVISLVCTPQKMDKSMEWGDEKKILQITNYSTTWELELFWVDEEGSLVSRGNIAPGTCLFCMCSKNQLWALKAKSMKSTTTTISSPKHSGAASKNHHHLPVLSLMKDNNNNGGVAAAAAENDYDDNISTHTDEIEYPALMIIQLTSSSLSNNKCSSIIWTPFSSMSVAHRLHVNKKNNNNNNNSNDCVDKNQSNTPPPHMHIQVFDRVEKGNLVGTSSLSNSNSKIDNKYRDPRQQQKQRQLQLQRQQQLQQEIKNENPYKIEKVKLTKWPKPPRRQNK